MFSSSSSVSSKQYTLLTEVNNEEHSGYVYLDFGAQSSNAGVSLKNILLHDKISFTEKIMKNILADGNTLQAQAVIS